MRRRRPLAAWLAILAIALQALWPLLAQAKPRSVVLVPVCTVQGVTHYLELPSDNTPVEQKAASQHDHCSFCSFGAAVVGAAVCLGSACPDCKPVFSVEDSFAEGSNPLSKRSRAPPCLPDVHVNDQHFGRTNEEASVLGPRSARAGDAVAGRRLVRLGVLHA